MPSTPSKTTAGARRISSRTPASIAHSPLLSPRLQHRIRAMNRFWHGQQEVIVQNVRIAHPAATDAIGGDEHGDLRPDLHLTMWVGGAASFLPLKSATYSVTSSWARCRSRAPGTISRWATGVLLSPSPWCLSRVNAAVSCGLNSHPNAWMRKNLGILAASSSATHHARRYAVGQAGPAGPLPTLARSQYRRLSTAGAVFVGSSYRLHGSRHVRPRGDRCRGVGAGPVGLLAVSTRTTRRERIIASTLSLRLRAKERAAQLTSQLRR